MTCFSTFVYLCSFQLSVKGLYDNLPSCYHFPLKSLRFHLYFLAYKAIPTQLFPRILIKISIFIDGSILIFKESFCSQKRPFRITWDLNVQCKEFPNIKLVFSLNFQTCFKDSSILSVHLVNFM